MIKIDNITYICDEGNVFVHKNDKNTYLGNIIQIGKLPSGGNDSIDNYEEVNDITLINLSNITNNDEKKDNYTIPLEFGVTTESFI